MSFATSFPRIMGLTLAFAAGAGATFWLTKQPAPPQKPARAQSEKAVPERVTQVQKVAALPSVRSAGERSPGSAVTDLLAHSVPSRHAFELEGWKLAGIGIESAMTRLGQLKDLHERTAFLTGMFEQLALNQRPAESLAVLKRLHERLDRDAAMAALLRGWSRSPEVLKVNSEFGVAGHLGMHLLTDKNSRVSPQEVAAFAREFTAGSQRSTLLAEVAAKLAKTDPVAAFALGDELTGQQQMQFMHRFAEGWARQDPGAAMKWAATVPDEVTRAALQASIIEAEAEMNIAGAARHALELPGGTQVRTQALQTVGSGWGARDTRAALQWADGLADEADRAAAQAGIKASAPVGIGALLGTEEGLPVISGLMDGGAAQRAGTLQKGDRILAVSDGSGQWVDAKDANLADVVGLIRGDVGSAVSLRIQPGGGGASRVITITRQQIMRTPEEKIVQ